LGRECYGA